MHGQTRTERNRANEITVGYHTSGVFASMHCLRLTLSLPMTGDKAYKLGRTGAWLHSEQTEQPVAQ